MIRPRHLLRLIHIHVVLARHGLDNIIFTFHLLRPFRFLLYLAPWTWRRRVQAPRGERLRRALEDLGPIFVKFGQALSTRRDLLPPDIAAELAQLQDNVPPFPGAQARHLIETALGQPVTQAFANFDEAPLASASIAQVHAATLADGQNVVVKVLRPGVERQIRRDVDLLFVIARLAARYWREGRRLRPVEVVAEYEKTVFDELDLLREAANAAQLQRNFAGSNLLHVPTVHWPLSRRNVLVIERIHGIPIGNIAALQARGVNMQVLAERGVEIFFTQVFRDNFFHADMHPGNIFVNAEKPEQPQYVAVDFGIIGTLAPEDQRYLALNFLAFFNRDYHKVAELHVESGWVPAGTRIADFEAAIRTVCEPIFNKPLKDISFGQLLLHLFQTARRFNMEVQPQLVLLQKTLLNIEGLGRDLYPELDLWQTAKPYLENWLRDQVGLAAHWRKLREDWPQISEALQELPERAMQVLRDLNAGTLKVRYESPQLAALQATLRANRRHVYVAATGGGLLISGALLTGLAVSPLWLGPVGMGAGLLVLLGGWWAGR